MPRHRLIVRVLYLSLLALLAVACSTQPAKTAIVLNSPPQGSQFRAGETVSFQSVSSDPTGITRVELAIDGQIVRTDSPPGSQGQAVFSLVQTWTATPGDHTVTVRAYNAASGASEPAAISLTVAPAVAQTPTVASAVAQTSPGNTPLALPSQTPGVSTSTTATPTQTRAQPTQLSVPATLTPVIRSNPPGMKTWSGGTAPIETANLVVNIPNVVPAADARLYAEIIERAYETDLALFGNERPFGKKITINWDASSASIAYAGNPITMCGKCPNAFTIPPDAGPFHELVHDFTGTGRTRAARYITFNRSMDEGFANYFAYYYLHEVLKYSPASIDGMDKFRAATLQYLSGQYEATGTTPYSTPWKPYQGPDTYFTGMMFRVVDQCGWQVWPKFFQTAFNSGNPGIPVDAINTYEDMSQPAAKKAFADFVGFLGQACGRDLRPMFRNWHFELP